MYVPIRTSFIPDDSREIKLHVFSFNENDFGYNEFPELDIRREWTNSQKMEALRDYLKEAFKWTAISTEISRTGTIIILIKFAIA